MEATTRQALQWGVVIGASLIAAGLDLRIRRIPNILCGPLFAAGLIWAAWHGRLAGFGEALATAVVLALPFVLLFALAAGGAGDAKLMGAIGAWLGWKQGIAALCCVCIAGIVLAGGSAIIQKRLRVVLSNIWFSIWWFILAVAGKNGVLSAARQARPQQTDRLMIPYGPAIFAGVCLAAGVNWLWQ